MAPQMYRLFPSDDNYRKVEDRFYRKWDPEGGLPPRIQHIYHVRETELLSSHRGQRFNAYRHRRDGHWRYGFHGSTRCCLIGSEDVGEIGGRLLFCQSPDCGIYGILRNSFKVSHAARGLFGRGIYTTASSYKADMFSENHGTGCLLKVMLLCRYIPGRVQRVRHSNPDATAPSRGYDSVEAVLTSEGGLVNFPEAIVYRDDAIVPVAVITYFL